MKMKRCLWFVALVGSVLAGAQGAPDEKSRSQAPSEVRAYKQTEAKELALHIFNPEGHQASDQVPAIVFFFGGGWSGGSTGQFYKQSAYLASRGVVAICADYRTKKAGGVTPDGCVSDAKSAMRWVRAHAAELGVDPDRIAAGGGSAGGHLAAAVALVDGFDDAEDDLSVSCRPVALVLFNPGCILYSYNNQCFW